METSTLFFILAALLIAILIGYSVWSARREKSRIFSNTFSTRPVSAHVGSQTQTADIPDTLKAEGFTQQPVQQETETPEQLQAHRQEIDNQVNEIKIKLPNQATSESVEVPQQNIYAQSENSIEVKVQAEPQIQLETEYHAVQVQSENVEETQEEQTVENSAIVTLYVVAPEGSYFSGINVVQKLEELGLQYGEYHIFHRHIDNSNSPVLFSVANMMQPGIFDLSSIENFVTVGLVFFMHLPSPTNNIATLKMMISTADSLAQSLGGFVLNNQQQIFDENSRQAYLLQVKN